MGNCYPQYNLFVMSRMGQVVQEIMEMHDGEVPIGYTLKDYFDEKRKRKAKTKVQSPGSTEDICRSNEIQKEKYTTHH
jgi:hypothetical protein